MATSPGGIPAELQGKQQPPRRSSCRVGARCSAASSAPQLRQGQREQFWGSSGPAGAAQWVLGESAPSRKARFLEDAAEVRSIPEIRLVPPAGQQGLVMPKPWAAPGSSWRDARNPQFWGSSPASWVCLAKLKIRLGN